MPEDFSDETKEVPHVSVADSSTSLRRAPVPRVVGCLLVMAFLGVIAVLSFYLLSGWLAVETVETRHSLAIMKDIQVGSGHFQVEYQRLPGQKLSVTSATDTGVQSEGDFIKALMGQSAEGNPRKIIFLNLPAAVNGASGLTSPEEEGHPILKDPWGEMYYLLFDTDGDGQVANPAVQANSAWLEAHPQEPHLKVPVAIYSSGPDRDPATWEDNITSWR